MKILVVDDDLVTGKLLEKILRKEGLEVTHTADGAKALQALQTELYRIILTDWMMPEMDGPTLCRHVRKLNFAQYIYIILLTGKDSKSDAVAGLESGADDYIVKPFDQNELLARIRVGRRLVELEDTKRDTQLKLVRSEKMAAVGHLAAGVAHEINNPIGFISSNLSSLAGYHNDIKAILACYRSLAQALDKSVSQHALDPDLPRMFKKSKELEQESELDFLLEDSDALINDCSTGAARIKNIVHEMRYFAHPEAQEVGLHNLSDILKKAMERFETLLPAGVTIKYCVEDLPRLTCNAAHIEQAFANIIQNAIEAVQPDGQITISGRHIDDIIEIIVSDTGSGIAPEDLTKVFDPFFTTKPVGKGLGLGLTTAINIIRMHNGSIKVDSTLGETTSFSVHLPLTEG